MDRSNGFFKNTHGVESKNFQSQVCNTIYSRFEKPVINAGRKWAQIPKKKRKQSKLVQIEYNWYAKISDQNFISLLSVNLHEQMTQERSEHMNSQNISINKH